MLSELFNLLKNYFQKAESIMSDKLYTIAEMAKISNIPESTLRFYRDKYSEFIPYVGDGRKRRYKVQALEALRIIAEESNRSTTAEEIAERLSQYFTRFVEVQDETAVTAAAEQQQDIKELFNVIANALSVMASQKNDIEFLKKKVYELEHVAETRNADVDMISDGLKDSSAKVTAIQQQLKSVVETVDTELIRRDKELQYRDDYIIGLEAHVQEMDKKLSKLKEQMEERKKQAEEKKGFFSIFRRIKGE